MDRDETRSEVEPVTGRRLLITGAALIAGVVTWEAVVLLATFAGRLIWPAYAVVEKQREFALDMLLTRLAVGAVATLAFGAVVAWVAPGDKRTIQFTFALGLLFSLVDHYFVWDQFPVWYHLAYFAYLVPLAMLGGQLVHTRRTDQ